MWRPLLRPSTSVPPGVVSSATEASPPVEAATTVSLMARIRGHYEWDDDDLVPGQKKEGGLHQSLYDSEGNLKQATPASSLMKELNPNRLS